MIYFIHGERASKRHHMYVKPSVGLLTSRSVVETTVKTWHESWFTLLSWRVRTRLICCCRILTMELSISTSSCYLHCIATLYCKSWTKIPETCSCPVSSIRKISILPICILSNLAYNCLINGIKPKYCYQSYLSLSHLPHLPHLLPYVPSASLYLSV